MNNNAIPSRDFDEVTQMIAVAKQRAYSAINTMLVELYWQVGEYIHNKLASAAWGESVVDQLANHLKTYAAWFAWIYKGESISDAAILRNLSG